MSFWENNRLNKNTKTQYAELLIELVELNKDKQWLEYFYTLRLGKDLPGGGMGSLNDWGPSYDDYTQHAWFSLLYRITHALLTNKKEPKSLTEDFSIRKRNEVNILKCQHCNQKFQHPRIFENHLGTFYFLRHFTTYAKQNRLKDFSNPDFSYKSIEARKLRGSLESEYKTNEIILYDFVMHKYGCVKCKNKMAFDHLAYRIIEKGNKLELKK